MSLLARVTTKRHGYESDRMMLLIHDMNAGDIFTVKRVHVGRTSSEVEFIEIPNKFFNTVNFDFLNEDLTEIEDVYNLDHPDVKQMYNNGDSE